jgi:tRNA (cytidine32/uridine32-2'-O)-methyltransferase
MIENLKIVLVEPSHPGNIGAVARSMMTMGLLELVLVNPKKFPHCEATKRAAGAQSVLENASVVPDLHSAVADCGLIFGTSVRDREVAWPTLSPRDAAQSLIDHTQSSESATVSGQRAAILFGRESSGLTNQEMDLCSAQIRIPANTDYSSLNLASAVQIIAYECRVHALSCLEQQLELAGSNIQNAPKNASQQRQVSASLAQRDAHLTHLEQTLEQLDFVKSNSSTVLMRKLTRLYNKAQLSVEEIQILRGILTAIQTVLGRSSKP